MSDTDSSFKRPKVLIVGAGLGGVVLGALLERAGVDFQIYERAAVVKPLGNDPTMQHVMSALPPFLLLSFCCIGSAMAFGCNVMDLFRQLGIEEEFLSHAKPTHTLEVFNPKKELLMKFDNLEQEAK
jgi:2-polyprenyl-6-methoxyphenol hydroxylase-like FAD-dependent oxidoreductase